MEDTCTTSQRFWIPFVNESFFFVASAIALKEPDNPTQVKVWAFNPSEKITSFSNGEVLQLNKIELDGLGSLVKGNHAEQIFQDFAMLQNFRKLEADNNYAEDLEELRGLNENTIKRLSNFLSQWRA